MDGQPDRFIIFFIVKNQRFTDLSFSKYKGWTMFVSLLWRKGWTRY